MTTFYDYQKSTNPLINFLTVLGSEEHPKINQAGLALLSYLIEQESNLSTVLKQNIPLLKHYYNEQSVWVSNIFNLLSDLEVDNSVSTNVYETFMEHIFLQGVEIQPVRKYIVEAKDLNDIDEKLQQQPDQFIHGAFSTLAPNARYKWQIERQLFLLKYSFQHLPRDIFIEQLIHYNTFHQAVAYDYHDIVDFFIQNNIDINLHNHQKDTPLLWAKSLSMIQKLDKAGANWTLVNERGEDALSQYAKLSDESARKSMMNYAKKQTLHSLSNNIDKLSVEVIQQRNAKILLNLVSSDKTKKEIETFLKSYDIANIGTIVDDDGNNLVQISLKKHNWARARMFLNFCPSHHQNHAGHSSLAILLGLNNSHIPREPEALDLLKHFWNKRQNNNIKNPFEFGIHNIFSTYNSPPPFWLNREHKEICELINPQSSLINLSEFERLKFRTGANTGKTLFALDFLAESMQKNGYHEIDLQPVVDQMLNSELTKPYFYYNFEPEKFNLLLQTTLLFEKYNIDYHQEQFEPYLKDKIMNYLHAGIKELANRKQKDTHNYENEEFQFMNRAETLFLFLLERKYITEINEFPQEAIFSEHFSSDTQLGMQYAYMLHTAEKAKEGAIHKKNKISKI